MGALQNLQCVRVAGSVDLIFDRDDVDVIGVVPIDRVGGVLLRFHVGNAIGVRQNHAGVGMLAVNIHPQHNENGKQYADPADGQRRQQCLLVGFGNFQLHAAGLPQCFLYYTIHRCLCLFPAVPAYPVPDQNRGGACHAAGCRQRGTKRKIAGGRGAGGYVGAAVRHHPSAVPPGVRRD